MRMMIEGWELGSWGQGARLVLERAGEEMPSKYKIDRDERGDLLRDLRKVYKSDDLREFMQILRKHGIKDEDPRFSEIVAFFRDLKAGKKK